jgi:hypothetical protein
VCRFNFCISICICVIIDLVLPRAYHGKGNVKRYGTCDLSHDNRSATSRLSAQQLLLPEKSSKVAFAANGDGPQVDFSPTKFVAVVPTL